MKTSIVDIQVRYAETDQMGVVYHANYLVWLELGRTRFIEDLGFRYAEMEKDGLLSPVTNVNLDYKKPAKYGDQVTVETWIETYNGLTVTYGYTVKNQMGEECVKATTDHILVKADTFKPVRLKRTYPEWDQAYRHAMSNEG